MWKNTNVCLTEYSKNGVKNVNKSVGTTNIRDH